MRRFAAVGIPSVALFLAAGMIVAPPARAGVETIVVTTTDDELNVDGDCSLREAVVASNTNVAVDACAAGTPGVDSIELPAATFRLTIDGADEDLAATGDLDILEPVNFGTPMGERATIDAGGLDRIFDVAESAGGFSARILTLMNGDAGDGAGGAIRLRDSCASVGPIGNSFLENLVVRSNRASVGGAIDIGDCHNIDLRWSSIIDNHAATGGAIALHDSAFLLIESSTLGGNVADVAGGGLWADHEADGFIALVFATFAHNTAPQGAALHVTAANGPTTNMTVIADNDGPACGGTAQPAGLGSLSDDPSCAFLDQVADAGLAPRTTVVGVAVYPLTEDSPARDVEGGLDPCPGEWVSDQIGTSRPQDGDGDGVALCDAGAVEAAAVPVAGPTPGPLPDTALLPADVGVFPWIIGGVVIACLLLPAGRRLRSNAPRPPRSMK